MRKEGDKLLLHWLHFDPDSEEAVAQRSSIGLDIDIDSSSSSSASVSTGNRHDIVLRFLGLLDVENLEQDATSIVERLIELVDADVTERQGEVGASIFRNSTGTGTSSDQSLQKPFFSMTQAVTVEQAFLCRHVCAYLHNKGKGKGKGGRQGQSAKKVERGEGDEL